MSRNPNGFINIGITGSGGPAGVAVILAARQLGYRIVSLDADSLAVGLRLGDEYDLLPKADSPDFAVRVLEVARDHHLNALVSTVAEEYQQLIPLSATLETIGCRSWYPTASATELCLDKLLFAQAMAAGGVSHPLTIPGGSDVTSIPGPWVVKPRRGRGSVGVAVEHDADTAFSLTRGRDVVIQTQLMGREFTADLLIDRSGGLMACVPRWRLEVKAGISTKGRTFSSTSVAAVCRRTVAVVGLTGPANLQGFIDPEGEVSVIEVNPRFSGGLPLTIAAGANTVDSYIAGILHPNAPLSELSARSGVTMLRYFAEIFEDQDCLDAKD